MGSSLVIACRGRHWGQLPRRFFYRLGVQAISENGCADHWWTAGRHRCIGRDRLDQSRLDVSGNTNPPRYFSRTPRSRRTQTPPLWVSPVNGSMGSRHVLRISEKVTMCGDQNGTGQTLPSRGNSGNRNAAPRSTHREYSTSKIQRVTGDQGPGILETGHRVSIKNRRVEAAPTFHIVSTRRRTHSVRYTLSRQCLIPAIGLHQ